MLEKSLTTIGGRGWWLKGGWNEWMEMMLFDACLLSKNHILNGNINKKSLNGIMECAIQCSTSYFDDSCYEVWQLFGYSFGCVTSSSL